MQESFRWSQRTPVDANSCLELQKAFGIELLTAKLLYSRGLQEPDDAKPFLFPTLKELPKPQLMKGLVSACKRIAEAIEKKERVVIYGDYDVDGVTSTSILYLFLQELGMTTDHLSYFIPHRLKHGYGLQKACLPIVKELGCDLMITVDCGISSKDEVAEAKEMGIETIIIDHHLTPPELPEATSILNPHQDGCEYPDKRLAAVGVTFNLMIGLRAVLREQGFFTTRQEPNLRKYIDLVALGTVADVVPLLGVNRIFVHVGLQQMRRTAWLGIKALLEVAGSDPHRLNAGTLGFQLGPRINAAGRMDVASTGVQLLCSQDYRETREFARQLDEQNRLRRSSERTILQDARMALLQEPELLLERAVVLAKEDWHPGVIGIVASRLVEEFCRPVVLIGLLDELGKGSCRSIEGFHIYDALGECAEFLSAFGGHAAAAGLSIEKDKIEAFQKKFFEVARERLTDEDLLPSAEYDFEYELSGLSEKLIHELERLAPFGTENPAPILLARDLPVTYQRIVGSQKEHLQLKVRPPGSRKDIKGIAFGAHNLHPLPSQISLTYRPQINEWQGRRSIELLIKRIETP